MGQSLLLAFGKWKLEHSHSFSVLSMSLSAKQVQVILVSICTDFLFLMTFG